MTAKDVIRAAKAAKWEVREGRGSHVILYPPAGDRPISVSRNERHDTFDAVKKVRSAGLDI